MNRKRGRPNWIPPPPEQIEALAVAGLTEKQIAEALGIHQDTLIQKKREYSEFSDAIKKGQAKAIMLVANALFQKAINGDTVAMMFFLKCRAGWNDKPHVGQDGDEPLPWQD